MPFADGWLDRQTKRSRDLLDGLPPGLRESLGQRPTAHARFIAETEAVTLTVAEIQVRLIGLHDDAAKWRELIDRYGSLDALMEEIDQNEWLLGQPRSDAL